MAIKFETGPTSSWAAANVAAFLRFGILAVALFAVINGDKSAAVPQIYRDNNGSVVIQGEMDVRLQPGFNGSIYVGDVNLMQMAKSFETLSTTFHTMWLASPLHPSKAKLYVVGGLSRLTLVEAFDGQFWSSEPAMPTDNTFFAAVLNNRLWRFGETTSLVFDGLSWSPAPPAATISSRGNEAVVVFQRHVYVVGGRTGGSSFGMDTVEAFDGTSWSVAPPMPSARWALAAAVLQDRLYVIGGRQGDAVLDTVEVFDGASWSSAPPMPTPRYSLAASALNGRIFVLGGFAQPLGSGTYVDTMEVFDGTSWSAAPPMPTARGSLAVITFKSALYAIGGAAARGTFLDSFEVYNGTVWSTAPPTPTTGLAYDVVVFPPEQ